MSERDAIVAVTEADRDALERLDDALGFLMDDERAIVLQALADHRATNAGDVERLREALRPFADCCDQIADTEDDEEWAKFRLLIKDYRRARQALEASR